MNRKTNILMLDDDLTSKQDPSRLRLQPWLRWFSTSQVGQQVRLFESRNIEQFAGILKLHSSLQVHDQDYIDAIIIDIMWRIRADDPVNFGCIGFPDCEIKILDAGAQMLGLFFNQVNRNFLIDEIYPYLNRSIAVLSGLVDVDIITERYFSDCIPQNLKILTKNTVAMNDKQGGYQGPAPDFVNWVQSVIVQSG